MDSEDNFMSTDDYEDDYTFTTDYDEDDDDDDDDGDGDADLNQDVNDTHKDEGNIRYQNYSILNEEEIRSRQEDDIKEISSLLSVSRASAITVLCYFNWHVEKVQEEWFADEENTRKAVGLLEKLVVEYPKSKKVTCLICFDDHRCDTMKSGACGHLYCVDCWQGYIRAAIDDGPGCLGLRCIDPSCSSAVDPDMIDALASDDDKEKFSQHMLRSYVENGKKIKWCPAPNCGYAVRFEASSSRDYGVSCRCSLNFCFNCREEFHSPIDCDITGKWIVKNNSKLENTTWISAYTKPCPKCKRNIEKNQGCSHMTCVAPCRFEFCWTCLGNWKNHTTCNSYEKDKYEETEDQRRTLRNSIMRYSHYYERWATNHASMEIARGDLQKLEAQHLNSLSNKLRKPEMEFIFLPEAWQQIIECRRVLKSTYAYGYYLPEHEYGKKQLFEYLQGEAEFNLERLHMCAEDNLRIFLGSEKPDNFYDFKRTLTSLTAVAKKFFRNLVEALENGLLEVAAK